MFLMFLALSRMMSWFVPNATTSPKTLTSFLACGTIVSATTVLSGITTWTTSVLPRFWSSSSVIWCSSSGGIFVSAGWIRNECSRRMMTQFFWASTSLNKSSSSESVYFLSVPGGFSVSVPVGFSVLRKTSSVSLANQSRTLLQSVPSKATV